MEPEAKKSIFKSKTAIVNAIVLAGSFIPSVGEFVQQNPTAILTLVGALNIVLRLVTKEKVVLLPKD